MTHVVNTIQTNKSSVAPPLAAASEANTEMQTILAAITNLSNPTPSVVTKPKIEMQQILALLTAKASSENTGGGGGCRCRCNNNNNPNNSHNNCRKVSTKSNLRYKFYCWSHGINPTHDSCGCLNKFPSHQDGAVYSNQMGG